MFEKEGTKEEEDAEVSEEDEESKGQPRLFTSELLCFSKMRKASARIFVV